MRGRHRTGLVDRIRAVAGDLDDLPAVGERRRAERDLVEPRFVARRQPQRPGREPGDQQHGQEAGGERHAAQPDQHVGQGPRGGGGVRRHARGPCPTCWSGCAACRSARRAGTARGRRSPTSRALVRVGAREPVHDDGPAAAAVGGEPGSRTLPLARAAGIALARPRGRAVSPAIRSTPPRTSSSRSTDPISPLTAARSSTRNRRSACPTISAASRAGSLCAGPTVFTRGLSRLYWRVLEIPAPLGLAAQRRVSGRERMAVL